jgi:hypothetical protein
MTIIAETTAHAPAPPSVLFAHLADAESHPTWSKDLEWVRLDEPMRQGARGVLKPRGGPKTKFVISQLVPDSVFADTSFLVGARLVFRHEVRPEGEGSSLHVSVDIAGPLAWLWRRTAFRDAQDRVDEDAANLVALVGAS